MKKFWIIPLLIMIALFAANNQRWEVNATKSQGLTVVKWETDTWTGQKWTRIYNPNRFIEKTSPNIIPVEIAKRKEKIWTQRWQISVLIVGVLFLISLWFGLKNKNITDQ